MQTTDNQKEIFDVVNKEDKVVWQANRAEVHSNKLLIHRSIGVCVFTSDNRIFLQRRSLTKDTDSLKWTISCSGHVLKGDSYEKTAKREMKEELGVEAEITFLIKYLYEGENETEMVSLFKASHNGPFNCPVEEITEGRFFTKEDLNIAVKTLEIELSNSGKLALSKIGWLTGKLS